MSPAATIVVDPARAEDVIGPAHLSAGRLLQDPLTVVSLAGSCSTQLTAVHQSFELFLPLPLLRFQDALLVRTEVDGREWRPSHDYCVPVLPGRSWAGSRKEVVFAPCDGQDVSRVPHVLTEGAHEVTMTAWLPGSHVSWSARKTFELACDPPPSPSPRHAEVTASWREVALDDAERIVIRARFPTLECDSPFRFDLAGLLPEHQSAQVDASTLTPPGVVLTADGVLFGAPESEGEFSLEMLHAIWEGECMSYGKLAVSWAVADADR